MALNQYACTRCRRLKKKCSKEYPRCANCAKQNQTCEYVERKNRRKHSPEARSGKLTRVAPATSIAVPPPMTPNTVASKLFTPQPQISASDNSIPALAKPSLPPLQMVPGQSPRPDRNALSIYSLQQQQSSVRTARRLPAPPVQLLPSIGSLMATRPQPQSQQPLTPLAPLTQPSITQQSASQSPVPHQQAATDGLPIHKPDSVTTVDTTFSAVHKPPSIASSVSSLGAGPPSFKQPAIELAPRDKPSAIYTRMVRSAFQFNNLLDSSPTEDLSDIQSQALDAYFAHTQKETPFLDEVSIRSSTSPVLTYLAAACGSQVLESAGALSKSQQYPAKFIAKAQSSLTDQPVTGYFAAQIMLLLLIHTMYGQDAEICWLNLGTVNQLAISLGLNRSIARTCLPDNGVLCPRKLFFSIYFVDRMISYSFGRPVGISDDDIDSNLPELPEVTLRIVEMARVEGLLMENVHSSRAGDTYRSQTDRQNVFQTLHNEIEAWYSRCRATPTAQECNSFNTRMPLTNPTAWFTVEYYQLLMILYKPSPLAPHPSPENLAVLAKCSAQALSFLYSLYASNWFPGSWVIFYRFITVTRALLYCLCADCVEPVQVKTNIHLALELLRYFSASWPFSRNLSEILNKVGTAFDLRDTAQIVRLSADYQRVLGDNGVDMWQEDTWESTEL